MKISSLFTPYYVQQRPDSYTTGRTELMKCFQGTGKQPEQIKSAEWQQTKRQAACL